MTIRIIVISLYSLLIVWNGIRGFRGTKTFNDFYLGGGNVGSWNTAFSYGTAYFSAVLFIGFTGNSGFHILVRRTGLPQHRQHRDDPWYFVGSPVFLLPWAFCMGPIQ